MSAALLAALVLAATTFPVEDSVHRGSVRADRLGVLRDDLDVLGGGDAEGDVPAVVPWAFVVSTSAYAWGCGASGPTRTGTAVRWGVVAVDPRVIPLGTRLEIEGFDGTVFRAEDTGSAVIGRKVDIFWPQGCASARVYGRQNRAVRFV